MSNILILGEPQDVLLQTFIKLATDAGYTCSSAAMPFLDEWDMVIGLYQTQMAPHQWLEALDGIILEKTLVLGCGWNITPTAMAAKAPYPNRVVGFSPMALFGDLRAIELAAALQTDESAKQEAFAFIESLGLAPYWINETPGFVFPRILSMLVNEAASAVMEGVATPADIDTAMKIGTNYPEGPLAWADKVGVDVVYGVLDHLYAEYREDRYRPMVLLRQMVLAGKLGWKTGEGFFQYSIQSTRV
jgi:3-hydroxybutyryl-CoA dehydrogenase